MSQLFGFSSALIGTEDYKLPEPEFPRQMKMAKEDRQGNTLFNMVMVTSPIIGNRYDRDHCQYQLYHKIDGNIVTSVTDKKLYERMYRYTKKEFTKDKKNCCLLSQYIYYGIMSELLPFDARTQLGKQKFVVSCDVRKDTKVTSRNVNRMLDDFYKIKNGQQINEMSKSESQIMEVPTHYLPVPEGEECQPPK